MGESHEKSGGAGLLEGDETSFAAKLAAVGAHAWDVIQNPGHSRDEEWEVFHETETVLLESSQHNFVPGIKETYTAYALLGESIGLSEKDFLVELDDQEHAHRRAA